jgi:hypothetical protein
MEEQIQAVAFYCQKGTDAFVSRDWLDAMVRFFAAHDIPVREFEVLDNSVCRTGRYSFGAIKDQLNAAIEGKLRSLHLFAHRERTSDLVFNWQGSAVIKFVENLNYCFLGLTADSGLSLRDLFRAAYEVNRPVTSWGYGIGYVHPAKRGPSMYATGILGQSGPPDPDFDTQDYERKVSLWFKELIFKRRHLQGWFRDVYPVNLLSEAHVATPLPGGQTLQTAGLGTLTPLDDNLWMWEVPDEQMATARSALIEAGRIICK